MAKYISISVHVNLIDAPGYQPVVLKQTWSNFVLILNSDHLKIRPTSFVEFPQTWYLRLTTSGSESTSPRNQSSEHTEVLSAALSCTQSTAGISQAHSLGTPMSGNTRIWEANSLAS
jgi:hypothetical protein